MATVCGASLALYDAGIALKGAVAGVEMGLVKEGDDYAILTDIAAAVAAVPLVVAADPEAVRLESEPLARIEGMKRPEGDLRAVSFFGENLVFQWLSSFPIGG
jgi:hypothetical protein